MDGMGVDSAKTMRSQVGNTNKRGIIRADPTGEGNAGETAEALST